MNIRKNIVQIVTILVILGIEILFSSLNAATVTSTGVRTARYSGIDPFPVPAGWHNAINKMHEYFPLATQSTIWTVANVWDPGICHFYFPTPGGTFANCAFETTDLNEEYFHYFDSVGIKVHIQVEPGDADIKTIIDIALKQYKKHSCIAGFGIDLEWYQYTNNEWGKKVTDTLAKQWEKQVQSYNPNYTLFFKHPDRTPSHFPPTYRGKLIFVNDCEGRNAIDDEGIFSGGYENDFLPAMKAFADYFNPSPVIFQIGYPTTKPLWTSFPTPPLTVGNDLLKNAQQDIGVFWVDFGMKGILPYTPIITPINKPNTHKIVKNILSSFSENIPVTVTVFSMVGKKLFSKNFSYTQCNTILASSPQGKKGFSLPEGLVIIRFSQKGKSVEIRREGRER